MQSFAEGLRPLQPRHRAIDGRTVQGLVLFPWSNRLAKDPGGFQLEGTHRTLGGVPLQGYAFTGVDLAANRPIEQLLGVFL
jgi:hypothetical protein